MYVNSATKHRFGFTLIEVLTVFFIIAILVGLLVPAVLQSREASRRISCGNNLRQFGIALNSYESLHTVYPQGINGGFGSGHMMLLPFLEQAVLYNSINFNTFDMDVAFSEGGANETYGRTKLATFFCPTDPDAMKASSTSYAWNGGYGYQSTSFVGTFFTTASPDYRYINSASVSDGLAHTAAMTEWKIGRLGSADDVSVVFRIVDATPNAYQRFVQDCKAANRKSTEFGTWTKDTQWPYGLFGSTIMNYNLPPNCNSCFFNFDIDFGNWSASSYHSQGVNVLFHDSHVVFHKNSIAIEVWQSLSTRAGGESQ